MPPGQSNPYNKSPIINSPPNGPALLKPPNNPAAMVGGQNQGNPKIPIVNNPPQKDSQGPVSNNKEFKVLKPEPLPSQPINSLNSQAKPILMQPGHGNNTVYGNDPFKNTINSGNGGNTAVQGNFPGSGQQNFKVENSPAINQQKPGVYIQPVSNNQPIPFPQVINGGKSNIGQSQWQNIKPVEPNSQAKILLRPNSPALEPVQFNNELMNNHKTPPPIGKGVLINQIPPSPQLKNEGPSQIPVNKPFAPFSKPESEIHPQGKFEPQKPSNIHDKPKFFNPPPQFDKNQAGNPQSSNFSGPSSQINIMRRESPSRQYQPGSPKKLQTNHKQIQLNHQIPKNDFPFNPKKFLPEDILKKLDIISTNLLEVLNLNLVLNKNHEFENKLIQLSQNGSNTAKKILEQVQNKLKCSKCGIKSERMLELRCNHLICGKCFEQNAFDSLTLNCPCCEKPVESIEENQIFSEFRIDREMVKKYKLKKILNENNGLECGKCQKKKIHYYECCPHLCKQCFAEIIRDQIAPCNYCYESTNFDQIFNETFVCDDCGISNYFVGSYGKYVNDECSVLCITCSYGYYNSGFNEKLNLRLSKIEKIELSDHIFRSCYCCKQEKYKGNFKQRNDCQHYVCLDCEGDPHCKECKS